MVKMDGTTKATFRQWISYSLALSASFVYGCKVGWLSSTITTVWPADSAPFAVTQDDISWMASISYTSSVFSVLLCFFAGDKAGRRTFLVGVVLYYALAWAFILATSSAAVVIACFWLYGVASGTQYIMSCVYAGEMSSPKNRELIGTSYGLATMVGAELEILVSLFGDYRLLALFPLAVSALALGAAYFMVESPYYLVGRGDDERALRNLRYLQNKASDAEALAELHAVKEYVDEQKNERWQPNDCKIVLQPNNLRLTLLMIVLNGLSAMNCASLIPQTGSFILKDFKDKVNDELFVNVYSMVAIVSSLVSFYTIRRFDRRTLFLFGHLAGGVLQILCGLCYYVESLEGNDFGWLANVIAYLLVAFRVHSMLTFAVALEILKAEVFPHKLKEFYTSLLLCTSDWFIFALVRSYFSLEPVLGNGAILLGYGLISFAAYAVTYFFVPDTKNKTLLQIRTDLIGESQT